VASAYAEAKRGGETLCAAYRAQHRLPTLNVRPFAFVGPYQHVDRPWAINNFLQDALRGGPIRILGNPATVRSYMYPSDMAAALLGLLVAGKTGGDYNLGSPEGITLGDLAGRIAEHSPTRVEVTVPQAPQRPGHLSRFVPDVTLAAQVLGARPAVDLESALRRTIQWMLASQQRVPRAVPA
jgi:dTDP-glucose 4,6-dehydratase